MPDCSSPLVLADGSLVVLRRDTALITKALRTLLELDMEAANAPHIRRRAYALIAAAEKCGNSATGSGDARENSELKLGSAAAARILGVKPRRIRQLGEQIGGHQRPNGRWEFDAVKVIEAAAAVKRRREKR